MNRYSLAGALLLLAPTAFAGLVCGPVPAPVLGALGPVGLAATAVGYVAYKLYQRRK